MREENEMDHVCYVTDSFSFLGKHVLRLWWFYFVTSERHLGDRNIHSAGAPSTRMFKEFQRNPLSYSEIVDKGCLISYNREN